MKKLFSSIYMLCWMCLVLGVFAAFPVALSPIPDMSGASRAPLWAEWLFPMLAILCLLILMWRLMNSTSSFIRQFSSMMSKALLVFALWGVGQWIRHSGPAVAARWSVVLGVVMAALWALLVLSLLLMSRVYKHNKTATLWQIVLLLATFIGVTLLVPNMWGLSWPTVSLPGDLLSYHIGQLSLTFVTISVMSVLSDKSVIIYWENIAEAKLVRPLFGSFASCTAYSIACAVGAGISVLLNNALAFVVFLVLNVAALILLTLTMVDVYFNREQKRRRLEEQLLAASPTSRTEMMYQLQQHLHQAIESHEMLFVREVAELYGGYLPCFDSAEGRKVRALLDSCDLDNPSYMVEGIRSRVAQMKQQGETCDGHEDVALWAMLAEAEGQYDALLSHPHMHYAVLARMDFVVIGALSNGAKMYQRDFLSYPKILNVTQRPYRMSSSVRRKVKRNFDDFAYRYGFGYQKTEEYPKTLLEKLKGDGNQPEKDEQVTAFLTALLRVAWRVAQNDGERKPWLQNHPLLVGLENHLDKLDLTEEEIAALRKFID